MNAGVRRDVALVFTTRAVRLFAYGFLSVILVLYLEAVGLTPARIGLLLSLTLAGDAVVSLAVTARADRMGRRRSLILGALLMCAAGALFASTTSFPLLLLAATLGVISPSGGEVGPFLAVEQVALAQTIAASKRTSAFAWYNVVGSLSTALGALVAGTVTAPYRSGILAYAVLGGVLAILFTMLSTRVDLSNAAGVGGATRRVFRNDRSRRIITRLSALFALDAFAGGFVLQSMIVYWFHHRYGADVAQLGRILFGANLLAGFSALAAAAIARKIGLVKTMVFTHLPSNVLLMLVPLMPNLSLAVFVLLLRFSISQMDVPTRQAYVIAVVDEDERSAAAGITGVARTVGSSLAPVLSTPLLAAASLASLPFFIAGGLKIIYDLTLLRACSADFQSAGPPASMPAEKR